MLFRSLPALPPRRETDDTALVTRLDAVLEDSVRVHQRSDVPYGLFLSGGIDSAAVATLMARLNSRPVTAFTCGFDAPDAKDERGKAERVAKALNLDWRETLFTEADFWEILPQVAWAMDDPTADYAALPTFKLAQAAKGTLTVVLTGEGGDELFGGYNRYLKAGQLWNRMSKVPRPLRQAAASALGRVSPQRWERLYGAAKGLLSSRWQVSQPADKIHKLIELLAVQDPHALYKNLVSQWKSPESVVLGGGLPVSLLDAGIDNIPSLAFEEWMMLMDAQTYLPDDILVKMDRAAMSVSLETRVPLLDHRVVEFAARLPLHLKIRDGRGKWILRQILYQHVPREMIERPKTGFAIPLGQWMRGPLREWAETLLSESRLVSEGFLDASLVRQRWEEHLSGRRDWQYQLWNVLMFQSWLEEFSRT